MGYVMKGCRIGDGAEDSNGRQGGGGVQEAGRGKVLGV